MDFSFRRPFGLLVPIETITLPRPHHREQGGLTWQIQHGKPDRFDFHALVDRGMGGRHNPDLWRRRQIGRRDLNLWCREMTNATGVVRLREFRYIQHGREKASRQRIMHRDGDPGLEFGQGGMQVRQFNGRRSPRGYQHHIASAHQIQLPRFQRVADITKVNYIHPVDHEAIQGVVLGLDLVQHTLLGGEWG